MILADAFGIPAIRYRHKSNSESDFKYLDYLSVTTPKMPWPEIKSHYFLKFELELQKILDISDTRLKYLQLTIPQLQEELMESLTSYLNS